RPAAQLPVELLGQPRHPAGGQGPFVVVGLTAVHADDHDGVGRWFVVAAVDDERQAFHCSPRVRAARYGQRGGHHSTHRWGLPPILCASCPRVNARRVMARLATRWDRLRSPGGDGPPGGAVAAYGGAMAVTLQQLEIFRAVAQNLSFSVAARQVYTSQPHVSNQIRKLEEHYRVPLFVRSRPGISLTEAGAALYERITAILDDIDEAEQGIQQFRGLRRGSVTVAATASAGNHL